MSIYLTMFGWSSRGRIEYSRSAGALCFLLLGKRIVLQANTCAPSRSVAILESRCEAGLPARLICEPPSRPRQRHPVPGSYYRPRPTRILPSSQADIKPSNIKGAKGDTATGDRMGVQLYMIVTLSLEHVVCIRSCIHWV